MDATRMGFGAKTLPHLGNLTRLPLKTKLSLLPLNLLPKYMTLSLRSTKQNLCVKASTESNGDVESSRPLPHFSPDLWGDQIFSVPTENSEFDALATEIESFMKPKVRNMLISSRNTDKERIVLIHSLVCLGISHYYEKEIVEILDHAFRKLDRLIADEDNLETIAIMFEVFRLYGHQISFDVFDRFKGVDAKFKEHLVRDVKGMLQLYEAAHLSTPSEDIMDEALSFTRYHLESLAGQEGIAPHISRHIQNALYKPRFLKIETVAVREYISFYEKEGHDKTLLKFAKLNINFCQLHYVRELKSLTKWWKDMDLASKLPYTRDRLFLTFVGCIGMFPEPQYSLGRIIATKISQVMIVMDDTCDAYGTFSEVKSLIDSLQRWDLGAIDELPSCLRIVIRTVVETLEDIGREMKSRGRSSSMQYTIEEVKRLGRANITLSKWARAGHVPTFDDYIEVGIVSGGISCYSMYSFMAMEDCDEDQTNEWFKSKPKMLRALEVIFRLENDIASFEYEMSRGEVVNGVNCYIKQHGVTKELAVHEMKKMIRDNVKIVMEEFLTMKGVQRPILVRGLNTARLIKIYYDEGDGYTNTHAKIKDLYTSLLFHPLLL
ncbi:Terpene synthase metal-binding domain [Arabidopsis thaliana x Arabidopsis arenosa]|uniref:Terpene synthase metal-binding domain n=1 Tax=Arabidopsis thaliana x Arabidopsis arenosa TaxID=1240361 RepID=A0A8T1Z0K1_9BRAS|nr:Terpene synthase metal-binding domain [Arabidopsis thaliana x Arabidopsis arenosa]